MTKSVRFCEVEEILLKLEDEVLQLEDETEIQGILRPRIIADVDLVNDLRLTRLEQALAKPPLFLIVVLFGFLVTMACFGPHPPNRLSLARSLYKFCADLIEHILVGR